MADGITLSIPRSDISNLSSQITRLQCALGKTCAESVQWAAWYVARAAATATRKAPATRGILNNKLWVKGINWKVQKQAPFLVKWFLKNGTKKNVMVWAKTKEQAKRTKTAKIRNAGLAKSAWFWAARAARIKTSSLKSYQTAGQRYAIGEDRTKQLNPEVEIGTILSYQNKAWKQKGRATVSNIGRRASKAMKYYIDQRLARRMK